MPLEEDENFRRSEDNSRFKESDGLLWFICLTAYQLLIVYLMLKFENILSIIS